MVSQPTAFKKAMHTVPDFEDLEVGYKYCFTFNPNDKLQHMTAPDRITKCIVDGEAALNARSVSAYDLELFPETSCKGRWHYHGYIQVYNKFQFYMFVIPHWMRVGTIHMSREMEDSKQTKKKFKDWHEYIHKQDEFHQYIKLNYATDLPFKYGSTANSTLVDVTITKPSGSVYQSKSVFKKHNPLDD